MDKIIKPVAVVNTCFKEKFGIPRQSGRAPSAIGKITLLGKFNNPDAIKKIEEFSHLWLIFGFSDNPSTDTISVRPPRLGGNQKVGVFASRSSFRPNGLGLSCVKLISVEKGENITLTVSGVDLLDKTPVYDIKPYLPYSDSIPSAIGGYAEAFTNYKLKVVIDQNLKDKLPLQTLNALIECLSDDPRPSYHENGRIYGMTFSNYNVKFSVNDDLLTVFSIDKI